MCYLNFALYICICIYFLQYFYFFLEFSQRLKVEVLIWKVTNKTMKKRTWFDVKKRKRKSGQSVLIMEKMFLKSLEIFFPNFLRNPMLNICSFCNFAEILKYCRFGAVLRSKTNLPSFASIPLFCLQYVFCYRRYF